MYVHVFHGAGERNREYALLMTAMLYRALTFSLLLASHSGLSSCKKKVRLKLVLVMGSEGHGVTVDTKCP